MPEWAAEDLALLGRMASDLTALAATIEVLSRRRPTDPAVQRAQRLVENLHSAVTQLADQLQR